MRNRKYYRIVLKNVFSNDFKFEVVNAVYENGKYYEVLTNKEIYMALDKRIPLKKEFLESNCQLIGCYQTEISGEFVALYLNFLTEDTKREDINNIITIENSIKDSIKLEEMEKSSKIKRMTKYEFLKKY